MNFIELKQKIEEFQLQEMRSDTSELFEFVIRADYMDRLYAILERYFGPPFKPTDEKPSQSIIKYTEPYGGIQLGQTLYFVENKGFSSLALLWPWGNGESVTVKIISGLVLRQ